MDFLPGAAPVAVVNALFVRELLGGTSPVGRRLRAIGADGPGAWHEIVGVVPDMGLSVGDDRAFFTWLSTALVALGAITQVLALTGVYAMMALIVTRRTREIGVRVALGASASRVVATNLRRAVRSGCSRRKPCVPTDNRGRTV